MKRRNFLRDIALSIACTLVPRILQPVMPEVTNEVFIQYTDPIILPTIAMVSFDRHVTFYPLPAFQKFIDEIVQELENENSL